MRAVFLRDKGRRLRGKFSAGKSEMAIKMRETAKKNGSQHGISARPGGVFFIALKTSE